MLRSLLAAPLLVALAFPACGQLPPASTSSGYRLCRPAIETAERRHAIPARLLAAIGRIESGRRDPASGEVNPWPWAVNAEGEGFLFDSKAQAVAAVTAMRARGVRSIDVGCMQVNLVHHPDAFANLEQAFDPVANADYAARFLLKLFNQTGTWNKATAWYHSATPELGENYARRVLAAWPDEQKRPVPSEAPTALASAWGATLSRGSHPIFGHGGAGRIIPLPGGPGLPGAAVPSTPAIVTATGRGLDAYRAMPVIWAYRPPAPPAKKSGS